MIIEATYGIAMIGFGVFALYHRSIESLFVAAMFAALLVWSQSVRTFRYVRPYPHYALAWGLFPSMILLFVVWIWSKNDSKYPLFRIIAAIPVVVTIGVVAYEARYHYIYFLQTTLSTTPH